MKAVYVTEFGGVENLEIREVENPESPRGTEILVNVKAAALNRADILQRMGKYPAPEDYSQNILGLEFAGAVAEIGADVTVFKPGDRVFGITAGGAQAEFILTDESLLAAIPENLSFTEAAAVPEAFITAMDAIFTHGELRENETLLIHAVGSGVGLAALQLAKARNITTIGTSRTKDKLDKCREFNLDAGILMDESVKLNEGANPKYFAELIEQLANAKGADVILDLVGAAYFAANVESLNLKGRIVFVGTTGGARAEFNISRIMAKRARLIGTVLRSRPTPEKGAATAKFVREVVPLLASGIVKPNVDRTYKAKDVRAAHKYLESNESFGKIVLEF